jgi:hypothetical protein
MVVIVEIATCPRRSPGRTPVAVESRICELRRQRFAL